MRQSTSAFAILVFLQLTLSATAEHPEATIKNEVITAKLYLPDAEAGYYRGTRFDWSGVIHSLVHDAHEYFGEWQQSDDPYLHDRITGPVDSFETDTNIADGETFLRIGVGVCGKKQEDSSSPHPFQVVEQGEWKTRSGDNWIEFTHQLSHEKTEQGYHYIKRITLLPGKPELVIDHTLTNTGKHNLASEVYNHNFFVMDDQPTGPDFVVKFPFVPTADRDLKGIGALRGNTLTYMREIEDGKQIFALLSGFGPSINDNQFEIVNQKTKAGVRVNLDRPLDKLQFWSPRTTLCPEPFVNLQIKPGQSDRWAIHYTFYSSDK